MGTPSEPVQGTPDTTAVPAVDTTPVASPAPTQTAPAPAAAADPASAPAQSQPTSSPSKPAAQLVELPGPDGSPLYGFPIIRREVDLRDDKGEGEHYHQLTVALLGGGQVVVHEDDVAPVQL